MYNQDDSAMFYRFNGWVEILDVSIIDAYKLFLTIIEAPSAFTSFPGSK